MSILFTTQAGPSIYLLHNGTLRVWPDEGFGEFYGPAPWRIGFPYPKAPVVNAHWSASIRSTASITPIRTSKVTAVFHSGWFLNVIVPAIGEARVDIAEAHQLIQDSYGCDEADFPEIAARIVNLVPVVAMAGVR